MTTVVTKRIHLVIRDSKRLNKIAVFISNTKVPNRVHLMLPGFEFRGDALDAVTCGILSVFDQPTIDVRQFKFVDSLRYKNVEDNSEIEIVFLEYIMRGKTNSEVLKANPSFQADIGLTWMTMEEVLVKASVKDEWSLELGIIDILNEMNSRGEFATDGSIDPLSLSYKIPGTIHNFTLENSLNAEPIKESSRRIPYR